MRSSSFGMPRSSDRSSGTRSRRALQQRRWHQLKQQLLSGLRWILLLAGLGFVNAYVFYYHPKISLVAIQHQQNAPATPPSQAAALPSRTPSLQGPSFPSTNPVLESPPPVESFAALNYFSATETTLSTRMSLEGLLKTTTLPKPQQSALLQALRDALPGPVAKGSKVGAVVYTDEEGRFLALDYHPTAAKGVRVLRNTTEGTAEPFRIVLLEGERKVQVELVQGVVPSNRVLADALPTQESSALAHLVTHALAYDVDLQTLCNPNDRFSAIVEKEYQGDMFLRYKRLLAVRYVGTPEAPLTAFWFAPSNDSPGGYYNELGRSVERLWLRSPVLLSQETIASQDISKFRPKWFKNNRKNELSYALFPAPLGTRVQALGTGVLQPCEDKDICNWMIVQDTSAIWYHNLVLSKAFKAGMRVQTGQILGTYQKSKKCDQGLCLALWQEGRSINPTRDLPRRTSATIPERFKTQFMASVSRYTPQLTSPSFAITASRHP